MPRIFFSKMLADEDMSKVSAAIDALDFRSLSIWVREPFYCTWDFVVEAWPSAVRFKLVFGTVQFRYAPFANVRAFFPERIVFAGEGHFGSFVNYDLFLFGGELLEAGLVLRSRH